MRIFNIVNISFYILVILSFFFSHTKENKSTRRIYIIICFIIIGGLAAFRYTPEYADYGNYAAEYIRANRMTWEEVWESKSPAMFAVSKIANYFTEEPQMFFVITGCFIAAVILRFVLKYSSNIYISVTAFWGLLYWNTSINIVRQYMAVAIILIAYDTVLKEKLKFIDYLKIVLLIVLASLFHNSALIMIFGIFILRLKNIQQTSTGIFKCVIIYVLLSILISYGYSFVYDIYGIDGTYGTTSASIFGIVVPLFLCLSAWIYRREIIARDVKNTYLINASLVTLILTMISIFGMLIVQRLAVYFSIFSILLLPEIFRSLFKKYYFKSQTTIFLAGIIVYYGILNFLGRVPLIHQLNFCL
ncbi:EpsG family protein [Lachnoclostridium sp. An118]|uniref:EpsG family protein n=1 Tax=Lachnoclostridium sp. An118 TaxID=1965547 RepID=UPI000B37E12B|nr:EpsG family protein [Lachnoclostridium sp. An118]OUQ47367.1 hypothetical protein B5E62_15290 [Lachnoclostridium sp. An118]